MTGNSAFAVKTIIQELHEYPSKHFEDADFSSCKTVRMKAPGRYKQTAAHFGKQPRQKMP